MKKLISAPIGIDLGSYKTKIAVAKRGGVQLITNDANFRQTPSIVGYGTNQRQIGQAGYIKIKSNFRDTIIAPQRFIGLTKACPQLRSQTKHCTVKYDISSGNTIQFQINYQGQKINLIPQQVLAAYFNKIKQIIYNNQFENKQAVIAIPSYLTQNQRKGIINSCKIAQFTVTRLLNDSSAISLDYGIFRKNDFDQKNPRNVLFLDFGHSNFTIFCSSFTKNQITILYQDFQRNTGCRDIDFALYEFYRNVFQQINNCDISQNRKAVVKLMQYLQKQRKILSGNIQHQINIQCLLQQKDLKYILTRQRFNKITKNIWSKIKDIETKAQQYLKSKCISIHSVELVGGGSRIPEFIKITKDVFGVEPSRTLNSNESVARGCALMAASKSPLFRVAQFTLNQLNPYPIIISWNFLKPGNKQCGFTSSLYPSNQRSLLFPQGAKLPSLQTITFTEKQQIQLLIQYQFQIPGFNKLIAYIQTKNQYQKQTNYRIQFNIQYNQNGIILFNNCKLIQQWYEQNKSRIKSTKKKQSKIQKLDNYYQQQNQKIKKQKFLKLQFDANYFNTFNQQQILSFYQIENNMCHQDRLLLQSYQKKNQLQSLLYTWKQKLSNTHKNHIQPYHLLQLIKYLQQIQKQLQNHKQKPTKQTYSQKILSIYTKTNDLQKLYQIHSDLLLAFQQLQNSLKYNSQLCTSPDKKYQHISNQQRQPILHQIQKLNQWLYQQSTKNNQKPKWQYPTLSPSDIRQKIKDINTKATMTMNKPPPTKSDIKKSRSRKNKMDVQQSQKISGNQMIPQDQQYK